MALNKEQLESLYDKYLQNQCSSEELKALVDELGADSPAFRQDLVMQLFDKTWDGLEVIPGQYQLPELVLPQQQAAKAPVVALRSPNRLRRMAVAAAIILLLGAGGYFAFMRTQGPGLVKAGDQPTHKNDVLPGYNKAVLTLADGSGIVLDSAHTGSLAQQGSATITNSTNGQLAYNNALNAPSSSATAVLYNQLSTPRGGQYQLVLPDGSKVWLNAASSIRYPTTFTGTERRVEIKGEAYFEIAKNTAMPFKVAIITPAGDGGEVQVLGTHFNVNAYDDEQAVTTTLLEGSVKLFSNGGAQLLTPGQQALAQKGLAVKVMDNADLDAAVAWKDGRFYFNGSDIQTIMRQVARWYDVSVVYEGNMPSGHYKGKPARNLSLSEMLKVVTYSGVRCRIEGKKIIVQE